MVKPGGNRKSIQFQPQLYKIDEKEEFKSSQHSQHRINETIDESKFSTDSMQNSTKLNEVLKSSLSESCEKNIEKQMNLKDLQYILGPEKSPDNTESQPKDSSADNPGGERALEGSLDPASSDGNQQPFAQHRSSVDCR